MNVSHIPNKNVWLSVFREIFNDLETRELEPHSKLLFGKEYKIHQIFKTSWFNCGKCKKKWHSFKGTVEFTYELKKEGKPKKRLGRVTLLPYGQQCNVCAKKSNQNADDDGEENAVVVEEPFWLPYFDRQTIYETLTKVHEIVQRKYYDGYNTNRHYYTRSHPPFPRASHANVITPRVFYPVPMYPTHSQIMMGEPSADDSNVADDNEENVAGTQIGDGSHQCSFCEACSKGKCKDMPGSQAPSGQQSRRDNENDRIAKEPNVDLPDDVDPSTANKVKWHLDFERL